MGVEATAWTSWVAAIGPLGFGTWTGLLRQGLETENDRQRERHGLLIATSIWGGRFRSEGGVAGCFWVSQIP